MTIRSHHIFGIIAFIATFLNLYIFHSHYYYSYSDETINNNPKSNYGMKQLSHFQLQDPFLFVETISNQNKNKNKARKGIDSSVNRDIITEPSLSNATVPVQEQDGDGVGVCKSFFSIMSAAFMPFEQRDSKPCERLYDGRYKPLLERQSKQMMKLNSTLTIFTSWSQFQREEIPGNKCQPLNSNVNNTYPNIIEQHFDPFELLDYYQFSNEQKHWISNVWHNYTQDLKSYRPLYEHKKNVAARLADLFRILLANYHQMAYLDLDMFTLSSDKELYLASPNVAVPLWREENGGLEIQNSGYCFTSGQLNYLIEQAKGIIDSKGPRQDYKRYTELGPTLFQRAIQTLSALAPTRLLFTTSNDESSPAKVLCKVIKQYASTDFHWIHLDGRFRGSNSGKGLDQLRGALDEVFNGIEEKETK